MFSNQKDIWNALKFSFMIIVNFIKFRHKHFDSFNKIIYVNIPQPFGILEQHVNQFKKWQDAMAKNKLHIQ